jgi:DNA adenine methylase
MLSNSETDLIKNLYKDHYINLVQARRMINADGAKRGKINEIVVTNYPISR